MIKESGRNVDRRRLRDEPAQAELGPPPHHNPRSRWRVLKPDVCSSLKLPFLSVPPSPQRFVSRSSGFAAIIIVRHTIPALRTTPDPPHARLGGQPHQCQPLSISCSPKRSET
ncbi:hypothetical protein BV20DRAFT_298614 [Pilatotrama ljubarskyi]|nr:hypothetical protein BV20DRAFT_298614 [Pilatotrama ljubarskyi]